MHGCLWFVSTNYLFCISLVSEQVLAHALSDLCSSLAQRDEQLLTLQHAQRQHASDTGYKLGYKHSDTGYVIPMQYLETATFVFVEGNG